MKTENEMISEKLKRTKLKDFEKEKLDGEREKKIEDKRAKENKSKGDCGRREERGYMFKRSLMGKEERQID